MPTRLATAIEGSWYRPPGLTLLLWPLSLCFAAVTALRRWLYRRGLLVGYRAPVPVVVVGNITVGGTGKTPAVAGLVNALQERGICCGIVSRGYGGSAGGAMQVTAQSDATVAGDEAVLLARATGVPVAVARRRADAVKLLLQDTSGLDLIVTDDGLQHYALARDFEIAVHDAERRFGNGHLLPLGPLREPRRRLATVDWVLERGGADPFSGYSVVPETLENMVTGERRDPADHRLPAKVHAVAGIAHPEKFFQTLSGLGFEPQAHRFPDHHPFSPQDLSDFNDAPVIMTEKDAVKCAPFAREHFWFLRVGAQLPPGLVDAVAALVGQETTR